MKSICILAGILVLLFPAVVMASTPPVQPSLVFDISSPSPDPGTPLTLAVIWTGYATYNTAPEQIIVEFFSLPEGTRLGALPVPLVKEGADLGNQRTYRTTINNETLQSGTYMLIATDPLSGATSRQTITSAPHNDGTNVLLKQFDQEQQFYLISGVFVFVLLCLLAILVRPKMDE
ncbi:MAG: hypothetical protein NTV84_12315 [Methanoregula sp.]|nr:hypothetical protein [Methanoregula sp.]